MKQLLIGTIVNTHGLQGELKVLPKTHFVKERFSKGRHVLLKCDDEEIELEIASARPQKDMWLIKFQNYEDINQVEKWKGNHLYVRASTLPALEEDEIYYYELYDCQVYDRDGQYLGTVIEVIETGANAVLRIKKDETTFLLPYVKAFVEEIDKEQKQLFVGELPEGIL